MNTFYLNTGVKPENVMNFPYDYHRKVGNVIHGTLCIPFECDAPKFSKPIIACDNPNLPESYVRSCMSVKDGKYVVCEIFNSNMISKFAYLEIKNIEEAVVSI